MNAQSPLLLWERPWPRCFTATDTSDRGQDGVPPTRSHREAAK